jgi:hypothetical protein
MKYGTLLFDKNIRTSLRSRVKLSASEEAGNNQDDSQN